MAGRDGKPNDPQAPSDGYATGLAVFVLRQAGVPASDPAIQRGIAWLRSHQRASGRWFTRSLSTDLHHFITHAGTAFAALALRSCDIAGAETASCEARCTLRPAKKLCPLGLVRRFGKTTT